MAFHPILVKHGALIAFDIDIHSVTTTVGQRSAVVATADYPAALLYIRVKSSASAPTAGTFYKVWLIRHSSAASPTLSDDGAATTKGTFTPENAQQIGQIQVTATADKNFYAVIDTAGKGNLGPAFSIAITDETGQAPSATGADHYAGYILYSSEVR